MNYRPARFLRSPDAMTVFAALFRTPPHVPLTRERWELHDGDFVDVDRLAGPQSAPLLLVLHGLEGSSSAHYVRGFLQQALARGWRALALNFRTCSGSINRLLRSYHSGETGDFDELVRRASQESDRVVAVGCSLGGNVLVKWLGEQGAAARLRAAAAVSVPFDLALCSRTLDSRGFWKWVYRTRFLRTLKRKALEKHAQFPEKVDRAALQGVHTLRAYDDVMQRALHGFQSAEDYYAQSSSGPYVDKVRVPLLLLSALDDPFIPPSCIPRSVPANVTLEVWPHGGHLGFVEGTPWKPRFYAEERVLQYLAEHV